MDRAQKKLWGLLEDRAEEIIEKTELKRKLESKKVLRVKLGIDPTSPDLHLGHVVPLRVLRAFQDAGHKAILIIGDFTGQIGDPAGRKTARAQLSEREAKKNERTYRAQAGKVLDMRRAEVRHNSEWFGRMALAQFFKILMQFSVRSAWEREDFQKRLKSGHEVRLHEAMYPVLQAYDSVMVRADVEIGALDQKLNVLAGRELQRRMAPAAAAQDVVLLPYLVGLDGARKMSKTFGNAIHVNDRAEEMFGKIMSVPDRALAEYARLAAWFGPERLPAFEERVRAHPRDAKIELGEAVAALYHGKAAAARARESFLRIFSKGSFPADAPRVRLPGTRYRPVDLVSSVDSLLSRSEARRLVESGAVEVNGRILSKHEEEVAVPSGSKIRIGKKRFYRTA